MEVTLLLITLAVVAGLIKGFSGFGLSLVLMSVLFEMGFKSTEFLPILVPLFVILDAILYFEHRKHLTLDFKESFTIHPTTLMTLFIGTLLGTYLLHIMDTVYMKLGFAIVVLILLFFLLEKVDTYQMRIPSERENGFFGLGTGLLTGLFTMNSVPTTLYLMYHQYPKEKYMANLVTFLLFSDIILVSVYLFKDMFTISGFIISLQLVFLVMVGFGIGIYLRKFVSTKTFKTITILILAANSLKVFFDYFFM